MLDEDGIGLDERTKSSAINAKGVDWTDNATFCVFLKFGRSWHHSDFL